MMFVVEDDDDDGLAHQVEYFKDRVKKLSSNQFRVFAEALAEAKRQRSKVQR